MYIAAITGSCGDSYSSPQNIDPVVALIPMGSFDQQPAPPKRKKVTEFCHHDIFADG